MPELPLVGDEFAGYRMRAVLGRGGMSVVYQAENLRLSNVIALKVLAPELAADDMFRARFLEESRIAASLNHPNVIPIYDMGSSDGLLYIAMRYVSGTDLRQMIKKRAVSSPRPRCSCWARPRGRWTPRTTGGWCTGRESRGTCWSSGAATRVIPITCTWRTSGSPSTPCRVPG